MVQNSITTPAENKTPATLIELIAIIVAIILVFWFFIKPKMAAVSTERDLVQQQQQTYDSVAKDKADLLSLISKLKQAETN